MEIKITINSILADIVVMVHFSFIIFVGLGGLLVFRWPRVAWVHVPAFIWGAALSLFGWVCPLTYLENDLREKALTESFIEQYLLPVIYPERLFGDFPSSGFMAIGLFVLILNGAIYWWLHRGRKESRTHSGGEER